MALPKRTNPRNQPIDPSISPHQWTITQINNKNKLGLQLTCDAVNIEYNEADGNTVLAEVLKAHRIRAIKDERNKVARERAAATRERAAAKRKRAKKPSKSARNKPDKIRRPAPLDPKAFDMSMASFVIKKKEKKDENKEKEEENKAENEGNKNGNEEGVSGGSEDEDEMEKEEEEETVDEVLEKMDLKSKQLEVLQDQEFECVGDLLSCTDKDLLEMGFKKGARMAIARKIGVERKRLGKFEVVEGGIDGGNVFNALMKALNANNNASNSNENNNKEKEKEEENKKKKILVVWEKRRGNR
eukprot:490086_1